ncbi:MAG: AAA family ATPase [Bacteroides sp.]|nr:AAA family ATPase [Bacteroides sp.]
MDIIGRISEINELSRIMESPTSEFVMVYGRRRVGKTYLIREYFANDFAFYATGIAQGSLQEQLLNFKMTLAAADPSLPITNIRNWFEAFDALKRLLEKSKFRKKVVFLDELPWMDTPRSNFIKALEHFWNTWASARNDVILIVCGSAASWMVKNIVKNHGGLHNRLTCKIKLNPFTLAECKSYLHSLGIRWENRMIVECYMILGGIPYYLRMLDKRLSLAQNVDRLFFSDSALLQDEFVNLYASLFKNSSEYVRIIEVLAKKKAGFTRDEIRLQLKLNDGGSFTRRLEELEQCGFIRKYKSAGEVAAMYQLVDFYSLFYFQFQKKERGYDTDTWMHLTGTPAYYNWCGLSFEKLCLVHLPQVKQALGISGVSTNSFVYYSKEAQIDLVIERGDNVVNLCEMKFADDEYVITKAYSEKLKQKVAVLRTFYKHRKTIQLTLIASNGVKRNEYFYSLVQQDLSLDIFL